MKRIRRIFSFWLALVLCLPILFGSAEGAVLCIEDGGQISIETSRENGICGSLVSDEVLLTEESRHCESCLDIPLSISNAGDYIVQPLQVNSQANHADFVYISYFTSVINKPLSHGLLSPSHLENSNTLASLRSVIILA